MIHKATSNGALIATLAMLILTVVLVGQQASAEALAPEAIGTQAHLAPAAGITTTAKIWLPVVAKSVYVPPMRIKVGLITDLTGALAIYGEMMERGFLLGMEYATGAPGTMDHVFAMDNYEIQVLIRDDQGNFATAVALAHELIEEEGVDLLVGTISSGATQALQEVVSETGKVLIVAPAAADDITGANFNEYTFRTSRENYQDSINLCEYLTTVFDTFVQLAPDYKVGYDNAAAFRDACTYFGGTFVADDIYAPLDTADFTPYMEQILNSEAEAWLVTWSGGGFVPLFQAAQDMGVLAEMGMGMPFLDNLMMQAIFQPVIGQMGGILYCHQCPDNPINDWLVQETTCRYGLPPDLFDADGMNAALMVAEALRLTGGVTETAVLIDTLEGITFEGPKGMIHVRPEDHVAIQDMYIVTLDNLDDPAMNFYSVVATTRPAPPCLLPADLQDRCGTLPIGRLGGQ